ncbi:hypothetical protein D3C81_1201500 [compost metagenome]
MKRIVPIAVTIRRQIRVVQEMPADVVDFLLRMFADRRWFGRRLKASFFRIRYLFVQQPEVPGGRQVIAQHFQRPDNNVAMALLLLDPGVTVKHKPLRPVSAFLILMGIYRFQDVFDHPVFLRCQKIFRRSLADVAGPPSRPAVLLQPVRYREVNQHIVRIPPGQRIQLLHFFCRWGRSLQR